MHSKLFENLKSLMLLTTMLTLCTLLFSACRKEEEKVVVQNNTNTTTPAASTAEQKLDDFQENLQSVKNAGFDYIFVFRRLDGEIFTGDDKKFLKDNSPRDTNQWRLTADEKAVVAGSNFRFTPENFAALRTRFTIEDHSNIKVDENAVNANANQNSNLSIGNVSNTKNANQNANAKAKSSQGSFTDN